VHTDHIVTYVALGSNLGDRAGNLVMAVRGLLEASLHVCKLSAVYETEPLEMESDVNFLNQVAEIHVTNITPSQMLARLLRIEYLLGRRNKNIKRPRTVDLDLLFFGDRQMHTEFLTLPHPRLHLRKFVLCPLNEIAPDFVHPVFHQKVSTLLHDCPDQSYVARWDPNAQLHGPAAV
jgi:2-amino-4-hydroxy-6-hydroxymethyldihydropteridine diphosphokinase